MTADGVTTRPVRTSLGDLQGTTEGGVGVWRGVPYAAPPVGARRFAAPAPVMPWTGVRDALTPGPLPPQGRSFVGGGRDDPQVRDEACLTVTVWSPDVTASLPVMVWLPGGAFVFGAGNLQFYNGSRLAANGGVVVVNVTYRIGVFGGLDLDDLGDGFVDNLALRDQLAALRWVAEHIGAFGGDAARVTVFGESAGATSVLALLACPDAEGLFGRAIAQSPALPLIADRESRARTAHRFLDALGVSAAEVRDLPAQRLRRAAAALQASSAATSPTLAFGLTHGTDLLPHHPVEAARRGAVARVPIIVGTNGDEASMFAWSRRPMLPTTAESVDRFFAREAPEARERVLAAYPDRSRRRALVAIGSDAMFGAPAWAFADACADPSGGAAAVYAYRFDHAGVSLRALRLGATHGSEIVHVQHSYDSYLGRKLHPLGRRSPPSVGRRMQRAWLDFATRDLVSASGDGVPAGIDWPTGHDWPRYAPPRRATRLIGTLRDVVVDDPDRRRREAWVGVH